MGSGSLPWPVVVAIGFLLAGCQTPPRVVQDRPAATAPTAGGVHGPPTGVELPGDTAYQQQAGTLVEANSASPSGLLAVVLVTDPPGGELFIEGRELPVASGSRVVLSPGSYRIRSELAGYRPGYLAWNLPARQVGRQEPVVVPLGEGFAMVTVTSQPSGATVRLDGEVFGQTPLHTEISAGAHRLTLAAANFATEARAITVAPGKPQRLKIHLRQLSSDKRGLPNPPAPPAQAMPPGEKVTQAPASVQLSGQAAQFPASPRPMLALRIGQRARAALLRDPQGLRLVAGLLSSRKEPGPLRLYTDQGWGDLHCGGTVVHCRQALVALLSAPPNPREDIDQRVVPISTPALGQVLAAILMGGVATDPGTLLLDLTHGQFAGPGEHIDRARGDGVISLLAVGGEGLRLGSAGSGNPRPWPPAAPGVRWLEMPPDDGALDLDWQAAPRRLLVVARQAGLLTPPREPPPLLAREKRWLKLAAGGELVAVTELAAQPRGTTWQRRDERASKATDIAFRELGPHELPGSYGRIWILHYASGGGITQRQVTLTYRVARRAKEFATHQFLRHSPLGGATPDGRWGVDGP